MKNFKKITLIIKKLKRSNKIENKCLSRIQEIKKLIKTFNNYKANIIIKIMIFKCSKMI